MLSRSAHSPWLTVSPPHNSKLRPCELKLEKEIDDGMVVVRQGVVPMVNTGEDILIARVCEAGGGRRANGSE